MANDLSALIARLEAAEAGSRELDGAVWYAIHEPDVEHGCLHVEQTEQGPMEVLTCELGSKYADCVGNYTTSLDAALALAERLGLDVAAILTAAVFFASQSGAKINAALIAKFACIAILRAKQGEG